MAVFQCHFRVLVEHTPGGLHDFMQREVEALPRDIPMLDIGSGSGAWLARLRALGFSDLTALDLNPPEIEVPFLRADLSLGEFPTTRKFKLVTSFEVFEHVENSGIYLSLIAKALERDGIAIITSPNPQSLRYRLKFAMTGRLPSFDAKGCPEHIVPLLIEPFTKLAALHGLRVARTWTYPQRGSVMFGRRMRALAALARLAMPDPLPGDSICIALAA